MSISKEYAIQVMQSMINDENRESINSLMQKLEGISDEKWQEFANKNNLTEDILEQFVKDRIAKENENEDDKFMPLNDFISYGTGDTTLHIHIVPKDARNLLNRKGLLEANLKLIDALEKIRDMLKSNEDMSNINQVFAVSDVIGTRIVNKMFTQLGFKVEKTTSPFFLQMFPNANHLAQAELPVSTLLTEEWEENKENVKQDLHNRLKDMRKTEDPSRDD